MSSMEAAVSKNQIENLPFTVRIVKSSEDLQKVAELRQKAYARHVPELAKQLSSPETADTDTNTLVLLVESKNDINKGGVALGTMRIHINRYSPLPLENSIQLPVHLKDLSLAEAVRFGIAEGIDGKQARDALFNAFYLVCLALKVDKMVVCARFPVHKLYLGLHFEDVFPSGEYIEMVHIGNVKHRVLMLQVNQVEPIWLKNNHFLYEYFFETNHPDINTTINNI